MKLHFYFDVVCPFAYLASQSIRALAERAGAELVWEPVLLGGILRAVGAPDDPAAARSPARAQVDDRDLHRQAQLRKLPFQRNPGHPLASLDAMRLLTAAPPPLRPELAQALFVATHVDGLDVVDRHLLDRLARAFGLDPHIIDLPKTKAQLRATTDLAVQRGVFGVPTFWAQTCGDPTGRLWWGADRMHLVEAALRGASSRQTAPPDLCRDGAVSCPARSLGGRPPSPARLEVFHDFSSPYSYLGASQVCRVAREHDASLVWRPFLLGALFVQIGTPTVPLAAMTPPRARYALRDLRDWARWWDVPFAFPSCFPVRTVTALRVSLLQPRAIDAIYRALWVDGLDIGRDEVLTGVLTANGFDPGLIAATSAPAVKQALRDHTNAAVQLGACGAPTAVVRRAHDPEHTSPPTVIWGQDRLDLVGACLDGWRPTR